MSFLNITISYVKIRPIYLAGLPIKKRKVIIKLLSTLFLLLGFCYVYFAGSVVALNMKRVNLSTFFLGAAKETDALENTLLDRTARADLEFFLSYGLEGPKNIEVIRRFRDVAENKKIFLWQ